MAHVYAIGGLRASSRSSRRRRPSPTRRACDDLAPARERTGQVP